MAFGRACRQFGGGIDFRVIQARQQHLNGGTPAFRALHIYLATMGLNNAVDYRQTQSRTRSHFLGGKKRIEDAMEVFRGNAVTGISYFYSNIITAELLRQIREFSG